MQNQENESNKTSSLASTGAVRCAIYARCATDVPTEHSNSVAEQIRVCTEYADKQGWEVAREFVQSDVEASGVSLTGCKSLLQLVDVAAREPRPFDCVLLSDISRLGRSLDRVTKLVNVFHGRGVFVHTVGGEFDSRNLHPGAWATKNFVNYAPQYLRTTARPCPMCGR